jgi:hypothetical protein
MTAKIIQALLLVIGIAGALNAQGTAPNTYLVHNLVSDLPGVADHQDSNLRSPWGKGFGASEFMIVNNATDTSTTYDGTGEAPP